MATEALEPTPEIAPPLARIALVVGLLGTALGLFVGLSEFVDSLTWFATLEVVPYIFGAAAMGIAVASLIRERKTKLAVYGFLSGVAAVLIGLIVIYVVILLALMALASVGINFG